MNCLMEESLFVIEMFRSEMFMMSVLKTLKIDS